jgi:hypothetical protein
MAAEGISTRFIFLGFFRYPDTLHQLKQVKIPQSFQLPHAKYLPSSCQSDTGLKRASLIFFDQLHRSCQDVPAF